MSLAAIHIVVRTGMSNYSLLIVGSVVQPLSPDCVVIAIAVGLISWFRDASEFCEENYPLVLLEWPNLTQNWS